MSEVQASLRPALAELERAFRAFAPLFDRDMPLPVITIQNKGRRAALGWYGHDYWQNGMKDRLPEINLCAEYLHRPVADIAEALIHEMVHYANALDGISDCGLFQYHKVAFRDRCRSVGLNCERRQSRGWAWTSLTPELRAVVEAQNIDPAAFAVFRRLEARPKAPTKMKKWRCGCTNIRAAVDVDAVCRKCGRPFVCCAGGGGGG